MPINVLRMTKRKKEQFKPETKVKEKHWETIEFTCPVKGKTKQKVLVTEYESQDPRSSVNFVFSRALLSKITDSEES